MEKFILLSDYKHLKAGDTTTSNELVRDSGYLCHLWHDGTKPLAKDVKSVNSLKIELESSKIRVVMFIAVEIIKSVFVPKLASVTQNNKADD